MEHLTEGAGSDTDAMVKIIRYLEDGWVLTRVTFCRPLCPVPIHLHFRREVKQ